MKKARKSSVFANQTNRLLVGLVLSLSLVHLAFEWETSYALDSSYQMDSKILEFDEILPPVTYRVMEQPKLKKANTDQIQIVEILPEEIKEKDPSPTPPIDPIVETNIDLAAYGMNTDPAPPIEVPRTAAEIFPHYSKCEGLMGNESYLCSMEEIINRIGSNFEIPNPLKSDPGMHNAFVEFVVDKTGAITEVKVLRASHPHMGRASKKAVLSLPNMAPAKHHGKKVALRMTVPLNLEIKP